jgi:hypothetical protein
MQSWAEGVAVGDQHFPERRAQIVSDNLAIVK